MTKSLRRKLHLTLPPCPLCTRKFSYMITTMVSHYNGITLQWYHTTMGSHYNDTTQ